MLNVASRLDQLGHLLADRNERAKQNRSVKQFYLRPARKALQIEQVLAKDYDGASEQYQGVHDVDA